MSTQSSAGPLLSSRRSLQRFRRVVQSVWEPRSRPTKRSDRSRIAEERLRVAGGTCSGHRSCMDRRAEARLACSGTGGFDPVGARSVFLWGRVAVNRCRRWKRIPCSLIICVASVSRASAGANLGVPGETSQVGGRRAGDGSEPSFLRTANRSLRGSRTARSAQSSQAIRASCICSKPLRRSVRRSRRPFRTSGPCSSGLPRRQPEGASSTSAVAGDSKLRARG